MRRSLPRLLGLLALLTSLILFSCGGGGGGGNGGDPLADPDPASTSTLSGHLYVTAAGPPAQAEVQETEPEDDTGYYQALGSLTPGASFRVSGSLAPAAGDDEDLFWFTEPVAQEVTVLLDAPADFRVVTYDVGVDGSVTEIGTGTDELRYRTPAPSAEESFVTAVAVMGEGAGGAYRLSLTARLSAASAPAGAQERVLLAGISSGLSPEEVWTLSDAVPGQVLVRYREPAARTLRRTSASRPGAEVCGEVTGEATLLCVGNRTGARTLSRAVGAGTIRTRTAGLLLRLRADPGVEAAVPNVLFRPSRVPDDRHYGLQWHYPLLGLPEAWDVTVGSPDVVVAVLDTGITDHPDLPGLGDRLLPGYDFVSDPAAAADGDGVDPDPADPGDGTTSAGSSWHGSHVAGTVAARSDNGTGVAGVDWRCRVLPVRVLGVGGGSLSDILNGIRYAAGLSNPSGETPEHPADVINLSLGVLDADGSVTSFMQSTVNAARAAGSLLVAAAGNEATDTPTAPASVEGVLAVGAVDAARRLAPYSNFGPWVDLVAPGGNMRVDRTGDGMPDGVLSTVVDEESGDFSYAFYDGTSMAAPHVAGVAALALAANPSLSVDDLEALLRTTATDLGDPGEDDLYGSGMVNAAAAVTAAGGEVPSPNLEVSPSVLSFGADLGELESALVNTGAGTLTFDPPDVVTTDGADWLSARLDLARGTVVVTVDRDGLLPGRYAGRVTLTSSGGARVVEVSMEVAAEVPPPPPVGTVHVVLVDTETGVTSHHAVAEEDAAFIFDFRDVPAGSYQLFAGTDADGDGRLCEAGDYCGAYPVLSQPVTLVVAGGEDLAGLDFTLSYLDTSLAPAQAL